MGFAMHMYRTSSATWSSSFVSMSSGLCASYISRGMVRMNALQLENMYIMGIPFSSNCIR